MNLFLEKPLQRWMIFALTLIVSIIVCLTSGYAWFASHLAESERSADWLRAAQIEPGNGQYWYKLGFNRQWDLDSTEANQTITYLKHAVTLDPRSANYWMELAGAYEATGQLPLARQAFQTALVDYPASAEAHWRFGSFLLRQGETRQAYAEIHFALQNDARLVPLAISRVWAATHDADALIKDVLPENQQAQQLALESFSGDHKTDAALAVWRHIIATGRSIPIQSVFPLEGILLEADRGDECREVWRQALAASGNAAEAQTDSSLIFNGGFEYDATDGGLDWHLAQIPGVNYEYDSTNAHSGKRALKLTFDGEQNIGMETVYQHVLVQPNTRYHFEGYLRTAGVTTDSGIHFFISFVGTTQPPLILDNFTGDHVWEKQSADFTTEPGEHRIVVQLYRVKSTRFSNKLSGAAWVDDVSIVPAGSARSNP